jgi:hypothetical protein
MIIKNEENESHFINLLELMVVNHAENIEIIPDQNGVIHSISNLVSASQIKNENGVDISEILAHRDDLAYSFDSQSKENMISTYASFDRPKDVSNAKVVLKLKNSKWGGVVYKTFAAMMGDKYESWVEKNHERSAEEANMAMKEAGIPLVISIKKDNEWIDIETIDLVGDISYNTLVANINENLISGDQIELRLTAGFKFWDLDYIGMDFSQEEALKIEIIKPSQGTENTIDLSIIGNDDQHYLEHSKAGDSTYFKFENINTSNTKRTIIMHSKGYYLSNEEYAGDPYWKELIKLRAPGGLSRLSMELYDAYQNLALEPISR